MSRTATTTLRRRATAATALGMVSLLTVAACSAPGASSSDDDEPAADATGTAEESDDADGGAPTCGTDDVVIDAYVETGFPLFGALTDEFTAQYPNVTFDTREDQFAVITQNAPRVLADDPPDIMRLPQMSELASDGLLLDLDSYAEAFGWDQWPSSQLEQMRVDDEGRRGSGPLYAMGVNFSMTGVFYNKALAEEIGMTEAPATLEELDGYLQAAVDAGIVPSAQFNGGATGGLAFPLQMLMASYGEPAEINGWVYQQEGATIDTPTNLQAVEHLERWIEAGFFADDINSLDYSQTMSRFLDGQNLLFFNGDWESGTFDSQVPGEVGFFLMPPVEEGGSVGAMSAPLTYGIGNGAPNADCAAYFLNWVASDDTARTIAVEVGGSHPMGPVDAFMPELDAESVTAQTLAAGITIGEDNGAMDFIANATGAIYAKGWTPNLQKLVAGQIEAADLLPVVQAEYESEIG